MAVTSVEQAAQGVWVRVTEKARGELPEGSYTMWFSEVRPTSLEGDILQLSVPSEYVRDWLIRHYLPLIQTAASEAGLTCQQNVKPGFGPRRMGTTAVAGVPMSASGTFTPAPWRGWSDGA